MLGRFTVRYCLAQVKIYGASFCGPCNRAKKYLTEKEVPFDYVNVE